MRIPQLRFTVRLLMLVVGCVALVTAGYVWAVRPPHVHLELAPQPTWASVDHDIFDVLLTDLIACNDFNAAVWGTPGPKSEIVFSSTTVGGLRGRPLPHHAESWIAENTIPQDVVDDLIARNHARKRYSLARYRPSNPSILVRNLDQFDKDPGGPFDFQFPKARGYVEALLPGYSRDGLSALVLFGFGPSAHGSSGYSFLKKVNGHWQVVARRFVHYS